VYLYLVKVVIIIYFPMKIEEQIRHIRTTNGNVIRALHFGKVAARSVGYYITKKCFKVNFCWACFPAKS
jgi:hypothetical protein